MLQVKPTFGAITCRTDTKELQYKNIGDRRGRARERTTHRYAHSTTPVGRDRKVVRKDTVFRGALFEDCKKPPRLASVNITAQLSSTTTTRRVNSLGNLTATRVVSPAGSPSPERGERSSRKSSEKQLSAKHIDVCKDSFKQDRDILETTQHVGIDCIVERQTCADPPRTYTLSTKPGVSDEVACFLEDSDAEDANVEVNGCVNTKQAQQELSDCESTETTDNEYTRGHDEDSDTGGDMEERQGGGMAPESVSPFKPKLVIVAIEGLDDSPHTYDICTSNSFLDKEDAYTSNVHVPAHMSVPTSLPSPLAWLEEDSDASTSTTAREGGQGMRTISPISVSPTPPLTLKDLRHVTTAGLPPLDRSTWKEEQKSLSSTSLNDKMLEWLEEESPAGHLPQHQRATSSSISTTPAAIMINYSKEGPLASSSVRGIEDVRNSSKPGVAVPEKSGADMLSWLDDDSGESGDDEGVYISPQKTGPAQSNNQQVKSAQKYPDRRSRSFFDDDEDDDVTEDPVQLEVQVEENLMHSSVPPSLQYNTKSSAPRDVSRPQLSLQPRTLATESTCSTHVSTSKDRKVAPPLVIKTTSSALDSLECSAHSHHAEVGGAGGVSLHGTEMSHPAAEEENSSWLNGTNLVDSTEFTLTPSVNTTSTSVHVHTNVHTSIEQSSTQYSINRLIVSGAQKSPLRRQQRQQRRQSSSRSRSSSENCDLDADVNCANDTNVLVNTCTSLTQTSTPAQGTSNRAGARRKRLKRGAHGDIERGSAQLSKYDVLIVEKGFQPAAEVAEISPIMKRRMTEADAIWVENLPGRPRDISVGANSAFDDNGNCDTNGERSLSPIARGGELLSCSTTGSDWSSEVTDMFADEESVHLSQPPSPCTSPGPQTLVCAADELLLNELNTEDRIYVEERTELRQALDRIEALSLAVVGPHRQVELMRQLIVHQPYRKGEVIIRQGDPADRFYIIIGGEVQDSAGGDMPGVAVYKRPGGLDTVESEICHLNIGAYFGERALMYYHNTMLSRSATIRAASKSVTIASLGREHFSLWTEFRLYLLRKEHLLLSKLEADALEIIQKMLMCAEYKPHEMIVNEGDEGDAFYMITRGTVEVVKDAKVLTQMSEGLFFGEQALLYNEPRNASIRAVDHVTCMYICREDFLHCLLEPSFKRQLEDANYQRAVWDDKRKAMENFATMVTAAGGAEDVTPLTPPPPPVPHDAITTPKVVVVKRESGWRTVNNYSYCIDEVLGTGSRGVVHRCVRKRDKKEFAMKVVEKRKWKKKDSETAFASEVNTMKKLRHRNIVTLWEVLDDPGVRHIYMIQDLCEGPILPEPTRGGATDPLPVAESRRIFIDCVHGLAYLHKNNIVHGDIKPANLLYSFKGGGVKIADFGAAIMFKADDGNGNEERGKMTEATPAYMAPELLIDKARTHMSPASDVWALGVTLCQMVYGQHPFWPDDTPATPGHQQASHNKRLIEIEKLIKKKEFSIPEALENEAKERQVMSCGGESDSATMWVHLRNLLKRILEKDFKLRIPLAGIIKHPWVTQEGSCPPLNLGEEMEEHEFPENMPQTPGTAALNNLNNLNMNIMYGIMSPRVYPQANSIGAGGGSNQNSTGNAVSNSNSLSSSPSTNTAGSPGYPQTPRSSSHQVLHHRDHSFFPEGGDYRQRQRTGQTPSNQWHTSPRHFFGGPPAPPSRSNRWRTGQTPTSHSNAGVNVYTPVSHTSVSHSTLTPNSSGPHSAHRSFFNNDTYSEEGSVKAVHFERQWSGKSGTSTKQTTEIVLDMDPSYSIPMAPNSTPRHNKIPPLVAQAQRSFSFVYRNVPSVIHLPLSTRHADRGYTSQNHSPAIELRRSSTSPLPSSSATSPNGFSISQRSPGPTYMNNNSLGRGSQLRLGDGRLEVGDLEGVYRSTRLQRTRDFVMIQGSMVLNPKGELNQKAEFLEEDSFSCICKSNSPLQARSSSRSRSRADASPRIEPRRQNSQNSAVSSAFSPPSPGMPGASPIATSSFGSPSHIVNPSAQKGGKPAAATSTSSSTSPSLQQHQYPGGASPSAASNMPIIMESPPDADSAEEEQERDDFSGPSSPIGAFGASPASSPVGEVICQAPTCSNLHAHNQQQDRRQAQTNDQRCYEQLHKHEEVESISSEDSSTESSSSTDTFSVCSASTTMYSDCSSQEDWADVRAIDPEEMDFIIPDQPQDMYHMEDPELLPVEDITVLVQARNWGQQVNKGLGLRYGEHDRQGRREFMEDRMCAVSDLFGPQVDTFSGLAGIGVGGGTGTTSQQRLRGASISVAPVSPPQPPGRRRFLSDLGLDTEEDDHPQAAFFAVYDGHNGTETAEMLRQQLHKEIAKQECFHEDPAQALERACMTLDLMCLDRDHTKRVETGEYGGENRCCTLLNKSSTFSGAVAAMAIIYKTPGGSRWVCAASVGDCRAVLSRGGQALDLTTDHKPSCLQEQSRVAEAGGCIRGGRLNGVWGVTRAFGDISCKTFPVPEGTTLWENQPLIAQPETTKLEVLPLDQFIIIACDGVWDMLTSQQAVNLVQRRLEAHQDVQRASRELVLKAIELGSTDNCSCIVVCLNQIERPTAPSVPPSPQVPHNKPWGVQLNF